MLFSRKTFIRSLLLAGGAGLLFLAGGSRLFRSRPEKPEDIPKQQEQEPPTYPAYARLKNERLLSERVEQAKTIWEDCKLCPRSCGVNRLAGETGFCRNPASAVVFAHSAHFGEEMPLVGRGGSGTIFFSNCNLRCVFCQNWPIAHRGEGREVSDEELAGMMLDLQQRGCHNINLVTPTHVLPSILGAVRIALEKGLRLPLCYNTSGYERKEMIELLEDIVDIYLPDLKFMDGDQAERYNDAAAYDYPRLARAAIAEMHRQVGELVTCERGYAQRGLMIRHLVMPNRVAGTEAFVQWVAENLSPNTYVNIMSQYRVEHEAFQYEEIARAITSAEYVEAMEWAKEAGLTNLDDRSLAGLAVHRRRMD